MPTNEAFVLHKADDASVEAYEMPGDPGPDEVLCRTLCVGICGSDLHYWKTGRLSTFVVEAPLVLGHETCAEVVAVGSNVKHLKPGDRVAAEPAVPCGNCEYCNKDLYNLCLDIKCQATPPYHGTLTKYFLHSAAFSFKVPDNVSNDECAMIEPLAVAVHGCSRVGVKQGSTVLITGSGPIGLFNLQVAKAYGASRVVLTDINQSRLKIAVAMGADETILVAKETTEEEMLVRIRKAFGGDLPTISMECSGVGSNFRLVMRATKPGGRLIFIGMGPAELMLPIGEACNKEVTTLGSFRYKGCFPPAIELVSQGKVNLKPLATHHYSFADCLKAFQAAYAGVGIKNIINVADS